MGLLKKLFGSVTPTGPPQRPPVPIEVTVSLFEGDEQLAVVGESNYQEALWKVVQEIGHEVPAILQPEPNNPYDSNAIAVMAAGMVVGYLSREDAVRYLPGLLKLQASRGRPIALNAKIFGGVAGKSSLGIWLYHDPEDFGIPSRVWTGAQATTGLTWRDRLPTDKLALIRALREHLVKEADPVERHFIFNELEDVLYQSRAVFGSALQEYEECCINHDAEMDAMRPLLIESLGGVPFLPTYKQVAIMKAKAKEIEKALWWVERGLALYGTDCTREDVVEDLRQRAGKFRVALGR